MIDNSTWYSVTIYCVDQFSKESTMASLEHVEEGATSNNLTMVIMKSVTDLTNMFQEDIARRMLSFGAGRFHLPSYMSLLENAYSYNFHIYCIIVHVS